jgi:hypothetical protein
LTLVGFVPGLDTTPPTVDCGAADAGWHADDVSIACHADDAESGLAGPADFELSTHVAAGTETAHASTDSVEVCDNDGNCTTAGPIEDNRIDKKAPTVDCGAADGVWHAADATIACAALDGGSGVSATDANFQLTTSVAAGLDDANASTDSRNVCDAVGNCTQAGPVGGNRVDRNAPAIVIDVPGEGALLSQNEVVTSSYDCSDGTGSGLATCAGPAVVDTRTPGQKSFTVDATDNVGNQSSKTTHYRVVSGAPRHCAAGGEGQLGRGTPSFDFEATSTTARGELRYRDRNGRHSFTAVTFTSVTCRGDRSGTITGIGSDRGGARVEFTATFKDGRRAVPDTFSIRWGSYAAGGELLHGNITVRFVKKNDN